MNITITIFTGHNLNSTAKESALLMNHGILHVLVQSIFLLNQIKFVYTTENIIIIGICKPLLRIKTVL